MQKRNYKFRSTLKSDTRVSQPPEMTRIYRPDPIANRDCTFSNIAEREPRKPITLEDCRILQADKEFVRIIHQDQEFWIETRRIISPAQVRSFTNHVNVVLTEKYARDAAVI